MQTPCPVLQGQSSSSTHLPVGFELGLWAQSLIPFGNQTKGAKTFQRLIPKPRSRVKTGVDQRPSSDLWTPINHGYSGCPKVLILAHDPRRCRTGG